MVSIFDNGPFTGVLEGIPRVCLGLRIYGKGFWEYLLVLRS